MFYKLEEGKFLKDLNIESFIRPLILLPDTGEQRIPLCKAKAYYAPCPISATAFRILEQGLYKLANPAQFDFIGEPAYNILNNKFFKNNRFIFWKPVLKSGYPIYIISPLFGLLWPGDRAGVYDLDMEEVFLSWRCAGLWRIVEEIYYSNECDGVLSYLPPLYNNVARADTIPWIRKPISDFKKDMKVIRKMARVDRVIRY